MAEDAVDKVMTRTFIFLLIGSIAVGIPLRIEAGTVSDAIGKDIVELAQLPAVEKVNGRTFYVLRVKITNAGQDTSAEVALNENSEAHVLLTAGNNSFVFTVPEVRGEEIIAARIRVGANIIEKNIILKPVRDWSLYLVQHTHTDIGYAEPQSDIDPKQLRYIDDALDYCDITDAYPDAAKFRWTCETAWAVAEYLRVRPKVQVERLLRRIKVGRIAVTGLYLNMSDMYDESTLSMLLKNVHDLKNAGIEIHTAIQDDVNGVPWCLADYLPSAGIRYLSVGENEAHARRPFSMPTLFWWESPSGSKILTYRGEHYHWGNKLGVLTDEPSRFQNAVLDTLNDLQKRGYPLDRLLIQFSGYLTDDSPPSIKACELVKEWNERFVYPHLRLATIDEFFASLEKSSAGAIPTYRLAWPDWWTDGFGSCALETAFMRNTQAEFIANQGLMAMAKLLGADITPDALRTVNAINENIAFYDEHTFGASESVRRPLNLNTTVQWDEKSSFAWTAVKENGELRERVLGLLCQFLP
ncbi:MAG TPA: glycosyl hydrolase family 38, partial [Bacteroidota bacterium]|nr:glycosyl hydrolase family 38 [Bacteroidota bacterium]